MLQVQIGSNFIHIKHIKLLSRHTCTSQLKQQSPSITFSMNILVGQKCTFDVNEFVQCAKSLWPGERALRRFNRCLMYGRRLGRVGGEGAGGGVAFQLAS